MREFVSISKAICDRNRARTLMFLSGGELCVCQIIEMLGLAPSTVSKHMNILYQPGLIESRKEGRWIYYRLPDDSNAAVDGAIKWVRHTLAKDEQILADAKRLRMVRKMDKEKLCQRYNRG